MDEICEYCKRVIWQSSDTMWYDSNDNFECFLATGYGCHFPLSQAQPKTVRLTCSDCDTTLTPENTQQHDGFDAGSYVVGKPYNTVKSWFIKCDDCFEKAIDNHLENLYN